MAKLPDERDLGQLPQMQGSRPVGQIDATPIARGADAIGQGVRNLGAGIDKLATGIGDLELNEARFQNSKANSEFVVEKAKLDDSMLDDTDYATQGDRYRASLTKARDKAAAVITYGPMRERFNSDSDATIEKAVVKQNRTAFHGTAKVELAKADDEIEQMRQAALRSTDPAEQRSILDKVNERVDTLVDNKWIDPVAAQKYKKSFAEKYAIGEVSLMPPEKQLAALREAPADKEAWLDRTGKVENATGNPAARAKTSSAMGDFQFIESTWLDTLKANRPDLAKGRSDAELLALRADPTLSRQMAGFLYDSNSKALGDAGIPTTNGNLYLAHFLGAGDAIKVLKADPGTPIADVVSKRSIEANRSVLTGRTVDSVINWADGKMSGSKRGERGPIDFIPEEKRRELQRRAETEIAQRRRDEDATIAQEQYDVKNLIKSDLNSIAATGKPIDDLSSDRVRLALGSPAAKEWQDARDDSQKVYLATYDMLQLSDAELQERVREVQPVAGSPNFARQQAIATSVEKAVTDLRKRRNDDPASAVESPAIAKAQSEVNDKQPSSWMPLGKARLAQQEAAGIPEDNQSPLTKSEAMALSVPLRRMMPGQERETVENLASQLQEMFGADADKAFAYVLRVHSVSGETAKVAGNLMGKLGLNTILPKAGEGVENFDMQADIAASKDIMYSYALPGEQGAPTFPWEAPGATPAAPAEPTANIPSGAIKALIADPALAGQFDQKYGKGFSKKILDKYSSAGAGASGG